MEEKKKDYRVLILDIETTSTSPKGGMICEIGLVELNLETGAKKILFDRVCHERIMEKEALLKHVKQSWIVQKGYMTVDEIRDSQNLASMKGEIQFILDGYPNGVTAFNNTFDFSFMEDRGFSLPKKLGCLMTLSNPICKVPPTEKQRRAFPNMKFKNPNAMEAYKSFFPESQYVELHRGADDAFHEADIAKKLYDAGVLKIK